MKKPLDQKPPLAAWATVARDEAQMSVEEVVDALAARGHAVKASTIRGIEGGSKGASVRLRRLMAEVYGVPQPGLPAQAPAFGDSAAIVAAIDRLTAAVERHERTLDGQLAALAGSVGTVLGKLSGMPLETLGERPDQG